MNVTCSHERASVKVPADDDPDVRRHHFRHAVSIQLIDAANAEA
jgi:hypothetical protein